jgi:hypothetical protein
MVQRRVTRIGMLLALVGLAILGASLFHWVHTTSSRGLLYSTDEYDWVLSSASSKTAISSDEVWDLPGACVKQFYQQQINNLNAQLAAHKATKPPPVVLNPPKKETYLSPELQRSAEAHDRLNQRIERNHPKVLQRIRVLSDRD